MTLNRIFVVPSLLALFCAHASAVSLLGARLAHLRTVELARSNPAVHFEAWLKHHNKAYASDAEEVARRLAIWIDNLEYAAQYNAKTKSHWIGLNHLADLTQDEYRSRLLGYDNAARLARKASPEGRVATAFRHGATAPDTLPPLVDWRQQGAVTAVKNQQQCGSCWAFSTTGAVEGANAIYTGALETLSEQELVDCDRDQDQGCSGGLMDFAYQFIIKNGGLDTEDDYPYTAQDGVCDIARSNRKVVSIDSFEDVPVNDEEALKKAVAHQPVAVAIEADQKSFQLYVGGVYDDEEGCGTVLDHGVLVVGYGRDPQLGLYWIVKNSWGGEWGEKGYIRIKMGAVAKEGMCGIAMAASYPVKTSDNPPETPPTPIAPSPAYSPPSTPGPDPDAPVVCDEAVSCRAGTTCCCAVQLGERCAQWGCCPYIKATCCDDHQHCCPNEAPICDLMHSRCARAPGGSSGSSSSALFSVPWALKEAPIMTTKQTQQQQQQRSSTATLTDFIFTAGRRTGPQQKAAAA